MDIIKKTSLTRQEINRKNLRVKLKITLLTALIAVIFLSSIIAIVYHLGFNILRDKEIENQREMARTLAASVESVVLKEAEMLRLGANTQLVIDALKENNLKYSKKGEREIQRYLMDTDKRWIEAPDDHPIVKEYLENKLSLALKETKQTREELTSITVADRFSGLAGSTARPAGFYSFDKDWWLDSYAKGRGKTYVGGVEYDEQHNVWCLPFAVPIEDETGAVIGAYKASIAIDAFFKPLADFKLGTTGDAVLVDDKAFLVYHHKSSPFANKFCEYEEFQKTLTSGDKWGIIDSAYLHTGKKLTAYSEIDSQLLSARGNKWFVFVERDLREIFAPLYRLMYLVVVIAIPLVVILALLVFIFSGQEPPSQSVLQVIKETTEEKKEEKDINPAEERAKRLHRESS